VGPQGVPLMVLLTVVAAGLLASTLWLWPVLARRGAAFVALRVALLAIATYANWLTWWGWWT